MNNRGGGRRINFSSSSSSSTSAAPAVGVDQDFTVVAGPRSSASHRYGCLAPANGQTATTAGAAARFVANWLALMKLYPLGSGTQAARNKDGHRRGLERRFRRFHHHYHPRASCLICWLARQLQGPVSSQLTAWPADERHPPCSDQQTSR